MKKMILCGAIVTVSVLCSILSVSCSGNLEHGCGEGILSISFDSSYRQLTRSGAELPDTSDFILKVTDSSGQIVYEGKYGDSPEQVKVREGSCNVSIISCIFTKPAFSAPQYGDEQCVTVPEDGIVNVKLVCTQLNCGVRLRIAPEFLTEYPESVLFLKSSQGRLMYGYSEKRIAYFTPGAVSLVMVTGQQEKTLMTRTLLSREMLNIGVGVAASSSGQTKNEGISVSLDTSRVWLEETAIIGGGTSGDDSPGGESGDDAMTVNDAKNSVGAKGVWLCAYIVGGDLTRTSASFDPPFTARSNFLVGPRSTIMDRSSGVAVELPSGKARDALNLVDNPHLLGKKILLKGDVVESYFGLVGLKNVTDYQLK